MDLGAAVRKAMERHAAHLRMINLAKELMPGEQLKLIKNLAKTHKELKELG